jgi:hypothetical protein
VTGGNKTTGGEIGIMVMIAILAVLVCGNRYKGCLDIKDAVFGSYWLVLQGK